MMEKTPCCDDCAEDEKGGLLTCMNSDCSCHKGENDNEFEDDELGLEIDE